jgi:tRNA pseudouridine55 synthase
MPPAPPNPGLVIVDKPAGWTSHDVVARLRRLARTRRVGHAGTLDPMATGVLVLGVGAATRLLHHLVLTDKAYTATIRLGQTTVTDDAEGAIVESSSAAGVTEAAVRAAMAELTGAIAQVPSAVSAIKVDGQRAYERVRSGEAVELAPRPVTVRRFEAVRFGRPSPELFDVDVEVECSSGTYVRALARDLGAALGVGGHLTALRRTRVGPFRLDTARTLEQLAALADPVTLPMPAAVRAAFPAREVGTDEARELSFGRSLAPRGIAGVHGAFGPDGSVVALLRESDGAARPVLVFAAAG